MNSRLRIATALAIVAFIALFIALLPELGKGLGIILGGVPMAIIYILLTGLGYKFLRKQQERNKREIMQKNASKPAELVFDECKRTGKEYALYLRNFSYERQQITVPKRTWGFASEYAELSARPVESKIYRAWNHRMPILALPDPVNSYPMPGAHRFSQRVYGWVSFMQELISGASLLIIYYATDTPGIMQELELISQMSATEKTIIIIDQRLIKNKAKRFEVLEMLNKLGYDSFILEN